MAVRSVASEAAMATATPGSRWRRDAIAGITTFFTMAYIVVVNPGVLSGVEGGIPFSGALTATVLLCFSMTLLMGLYAKLPFAVAPGMGINAFFAFTLVGAQGNPWQVALGMVFWAGVVFLIISVTPLRELMARAIPANLRIASAAGIGIFLTFIGLKNAGVVVAQPSTLVQMGELGEPQVLCLLGIGISVALLLRKSAFSFLAGMIVVTFVAWVRGLVDVPAVWVAMPDFSSALLQADIAGAMRPSLLPAIMALMMTDLFDSISTFVGVSHATGLVDDSGEPRNLRQGLIVDAVATLMGGLLGTSSGTAFVESTAGIEMGGRDGRTSVVTAICFLPFLFIGPAVAMVPAFATAPVLILVGALMFRSIGELSMEKLEESVPAFLTVVLMPLTFSITQGILWGFVSHVVLFLLAGRRRELSPMLIGIAVVASGLMVVESL